MNTDNQNYCARCQEPGHDTCGNDYGLLPNCPCCQDTMAALADNY